MKHRMSRRNVTDIPFPSLSKYLDRLTRDGLQRRLVAIEAVDGRHIRVSGRDLVDFSSNDYLGLSGHPALRHGALAAMDTWGTGARASRLMSGGLGIHLQLESAVKSLKDSQDALIFGSGYLAAIGIIPALCGRGDCVFMDRLSHASIVDGVLLSKARFFRFHHNDMEHLETLLGRYRGHYRNALIITESLFSMDGDMAPLEDLIYLKYKHDAMLMVDEAHATGIFGRHGEGLVTRKLAADVDIMIGTFGKAFAGYGAFAAITSVLKEFLVNRCRSLIFSTALPPPVVGANLAALELSSRESWHRERLKDSFARFGQLLRQYTGIDINCNSQIIPVIIGGNKEALTIEKNLFEMGFMVKAVRPPTVPPNTARLRISLSSAHTSEDLERLAKGIARSLKDTMGPRPSCLSKDPAA